MPLKEPLSPRRWWERYSGAVPYLFKKCAASGTGMPGPVRADGLFFACAKSKVKSTHKGEAPLCIPRKGARLWLGGKDTHVSARPDLFFVQTGPARSPRAVPQNPTTQCPIGPACRGIRPALGFFLCSCAAPYLFEMCAAGGRGCPVPSGRTACFLLVQKAR